MWSDNDESASIQHSARRTGRDVNIDVVRKELQGQPAAVDSAATWLSAGLTSSGRVTLCCDKEGMDWSWQAEPAACVSAPFAQREPSHAAASYAECQTFCQILWLHRWRDCRWDICICGMCLKGSLDWCWNRYLKKKKSQCPVWRERSPQRMISTLLRSVKVHRTFKLRHFITCNFPVPPHSHLFAKTQQEVALSINSWIIHLSSAMLSKIPAAPTGTIQSSNFLSRKPSALFCTAGLVLLH